MRPTQRLLLLGTSFTAFALLWAAPVTNAGPAGSIAPFSDRGGLSTRGTFVASPGGMAVVAADDEVDYRVTTLTDGGTVQKQWVIERSGTATCDPVAKATLSSYFDGTYRGGSGYREPTFAALPSRQTGFFVRDNDVIARYDFAGNRVSQSPATYCELTPFVVDSASGFVFQWSKLIQTGERGELTTPSTTNHVWSSAGEAMPVSLAGHYDAVLPLDDGIITVDATEASSVAGARIVKRDLSGNVIWARDIVNAFGSSACDLRFAVHQDGLIVAAQVDSSLTSLTCEKDVRNARLIRLHADGAADQSFGTNGAIELGGLKTEKISADPSGRVLVVSTPIGFGPRSRFAGPRPWIPGPAVSKATDGFPLPSADVASVMRFSSSGESDTSFGGPAVEPGIANGRVDIPFALDANSVRAESRSFVMMPIQYAPNGDPLISWPVENICRKRPGMARPVGVTGEMRTIRLRASEGTSVRRGQYGNLRNLTTGSDKFVGTPSCDIVRGLGGNDVIKTGAGRDIIHAGFRGRAFIDAGSGDDLIYPPDATSRRMVNVTYAGSGDDIVRGSQYGRNLIHAGPGRDIVRGGIYPDVFNVADGAPGDVVDCRVTYVDNEPEGVPSTGEAPDRRDRVIRDPGDRTIGCNPRLIRTIAARR